MRLQGRPLRSRRRPPAPARAGRAACPVHFIALALGLVNGLAAQVPWVALTLNLVLLAVMYAADHPNFLADTHHRVITLDVVHGDDQALRADLESRLGGIVLRQSVTEVDYVRDVMVVDVRYRRVENQRLTDWSLR